LTFNLRTNLLFATRVRFSEIRRRLIWYICINIPDEHEALFLEEKREAVGLSAVLLSVVQPATPQKKALTSPSKEHQISSVCVFYSKSPNVNLHVPLLSNILKINISLYVLKGERFLCQITSIQTKIATNDVER